VLISFEGEVKLCDFGIARANDLVESLPDEAIQGKAGYMSPEHARGEAIDARADVFACGIILWELLSGRRLYKAAEGESLLDVAQRAHVPPLSSHGLPDEESLHAIVMRALSATRDDRYLAAAGMRRDLEEYAAAAHMVASPIRFGEWLMTHFGKEIVDERRGRERALRALERGPAAIVDPIAPSAPAGHAVPFEPAAPGETPLPRGLVAPGPIAVRTKSSAPLPPADELPDEPIVAAPPPSLPGLARDVELAAPAPGPPTRAWLPQALVLAILLLGVAAYLLTHAGR
jgi:serine/threonine-protein kinase